MSVNGAGCRAAQILTFGPKVVGSIPTAPIRRLWVALCFSADAVVSLVLQGDRSTSVKTATVQHGCNVVDFFVQEI